MDESVELNKESGVCNSEGVPFFLYTKGFTEISICCQCRCRFRSVRKWYSVHTIKDNSQNQVCIRCRLKMANWFKARTINEKEKTKMPCFNCLVYGFCSSNLRDPYPGYEGRCCQCPSNKREIDPTDHDIEKFFNLIAKNALKKE